jgi:hypothetical protein
MGPPISIGNNMTPGPSVNIKDIHNFSPWSAGLSCTGYYVGRVTRIVRSLSLKGLYIITSFASTLSKGHSCSNGSPLKNMADIFMKALPRLLFEKHLPSLQLVSHWGGVLDETIRTIRMLPVPVD